MNLCLSFFLLLPDNVGLMVQCDQCEVWQHCDCVGLEEQDIPEHYYCEECKPENHSVVKLTHGRYFGHRRKFAKRLSTQSGVTIFFLE